jgi:hypothetical protein
VYDIEVVENLVDVLFPHSTSVGVFLRSLEYCIVNPSVCGLTRRRGVVIGVIVVCAHHDETHDSKQRKEQTYAWLVDTRGICLSEAKQGRQHRDTRWGRTTYTKDVMLLVGVELFPFRGKLEILNMDLIGLATGEGTKVRFVMCSFTSDVMD